MRAKDLLAPALAARKPGTERRSEERRLLPQHRRKDGVFFAADTSTALLMIRGRPCNILMVRDAASRLRIDSGLRREEEKEAFVGEVVHELRTPIAIIRGSAEALRKGVRNSRDRKEFLEFIESHAGRMARLVDRLLDLSSVESVKRGAKPVPVLLAEVVWRIAAAFVPVAKRRRIAVKIDIPTDLCVLADPADLPHVFGNLFDNAIKFTPLGGKVHIRGRVEGSRGIVSVRDTGGGIAPKDLSRIFERFYRSERTQGTKGTGLGLAIVRGIVTANNGVVSAENDPSGGAVFHVSLPLDRTTEGPPHD
jgi:signal transduction histidine kinase